MLNQRDTVYNKKLVDNTLHSVWGDHAAKEQSPHGEFVQMQKTAAYIANSRRAIYGAPVRSLMPTCVDY